MAAQVLVVVRDYEGAVVHAIDVTAHSEGGRDRIERGMLRQMRDDYTVGIEETDEDGRLAEPPAPSLKPRQALLEITNLIHVAEDEAYGTPKDSVRIDRLRAVLDRVR